MSVLRLFLDANIFIAGSASPEGGSAIILQACKKGLFQAVTTEVILEEADSSDHFWKFCLIKNLC